MDAVNTAVADTGSGEESEEGAAGTPGTPTLGQVLLAVEELWPESLAEDWDEVGLVVGRPTATGDKDGLVRRVAVCGGAGDGLFDAVRASQADIYVTADMRHHPASEAREAAVDGRPYLIDVSHFASEWLWLPAAAEALGNVLADQGHDVEIRVASSNRDASA